MPIIELAAVTGAIIHVGVEATVEKAKRTEAVIKLLQRFKIDPDNPPTDFKSIYIYTLIEYGVGRPAPIVNFFRNEYVQEAFRESFYKKDPSILGNEAERIIDWYKEEGKLGPIEYQLGREFVAFSQIFQEIVDRTRTPADVNRDKKIEEIEQKVTSILEHIKKAPDLSSIRAELAQLEQGRQVQQVLLPSSTPIRWLHLSDFHVGTAEYDQRQLFQQILDQVRERIDAGVGPDMVFISGDIANEGLAQQYKEFTDNFLIPLAELLNDLPANIFLIPGNHDVDRNQARSVQRHNVLWTIPEFLDPTAKGLAERELLYPRFQAYAESEMHDWIHVKSTWLSNQEGTYIYKMNIRGHKLGILGINTAWLSESDKDRQKLSPGELMLKDGLETLSDCDTRIVLGHHPIDWFRDEEVGSIRSLLGQYSAIYLHGHPNKNFKQPELGTRYSFLPIQAGAAFQVRPKEQWFNRVLWCNLYTEEQLIQIEPLHWSNHWEVDSSAYQMDYRQPGTDSWILPLPVPFTATDGQPKPSPHPLPPGWVHLTIESLEAHRVNLTEKSMLTYFNGGQPHWEEALSDKIPRRKIVDDLEQELNEARQIGGLRVTLLLGAAGEGKSTVLRQTVYKLIQSSAEWNVWWHEDTETGLQTGFLRNLPQSKGTWLIVSDEAERIAKDVREAVRMLHQAGRKNIQFLLCCRHSDWIAENIPDREWDRYEVTFAPHSQRGLEEADAQLIVDAWSQYDKGLGKLEQIYSNSPKKAAKELAEFAKSEIKKYPEEGAFFGAMLEARYGKDEGEGLNKHVSDLLDSLQLRKAPGGTLKEVFKYITAVHIRPDLHLSKEVLAKVLGCKLGDIKERIIYPLGDEAAIAATSNYIYTRHRAIANVAFEILSEKVDFDEVYAELVQGASDAFVSGTRPPNIEEWNFLSSHIFEEGNQMLGIRLAEIMFKGEQKNMHLFVNLVQLLRKAEQTEQALKMFQQISDQVEIDRTYDHVKSDRAYYYEWGTCEGVVGNHAVDAWLAGVSLADETNRSRPDNIRAKNSLAGLAIAFNRLFEEYSDLLFIEACGAAAQLGLTLQLDPETRSKLYRAQNKSRAQGIQDVPLTIAFERMKKGIVAAWEEREEDLPEWVKAGNELHFNGLTDLLTRNAKRLTP